MGEKKLYKIHGFANLNIMCRCLALDSLWISYNKHILITSDYKLTMSINQPSTLV